MLIAEAATALQWDLSNSTTHLEKTYIRPVLNMIVGPILCVLRSCDLWRATNGRSNSTKSTSKPPTATAMFTLVVDWITSALAHVCFGLGDAMMNTATDTLQ